MGWNASWQKTVYTAGGLIMLKYGVVHTGGATKID